QDSNAAATATKSTGSMIWWLIISAMAVLLIAIAALGNVLVALAKLSIKKAKETATIILLLSTLSTFSQEVSPTVASNSSSWGDINILLASIVLIAEFVVVIILVSKIWRFVEVLAGEKKERAKKVISLEIPNLLDKFNASVAVEKEKDILFDHEYDGIRELDNNLPPWWKYGFYITIIWSIIYLGYYHLFGGPSSEDEYIASVEKGKAEVEAYLKKVAMNVDENTVTLADASGIKEGKSIYESNCATCHGKMGEGNAGPNLTDDYWIHGGSLKDIFKTVKYGVVAKGMKSWQAELSPVDIRNVVSYVKTLRGTNPPNAKAPEGQLYQESNDNAVKSDSSVTASN
ncbi:MAG: c-type cytochrome, partial [Chitinophagales bacterium]|nr:c-type cytochrome [Chitinophagales bacterium]